jgi:hypothetical protein
MLQCLSNRNAAGFAEKEWLEDPWIGISKSLEQQVMDCGFMLARVLQRLDEDSFWWTDISSIRELIKACENGTKKIKAIKKEYLMGPRLDHDSNLAPSASNTHSTSDNNQQEANRLVLRLTASAIELGLCEASNCIMQKVLESSYYAIRHTGGNSWKLIDSQSCAETEVTVPEDGIKLAKEIVNEAGVVFDQEELPPESVRMVYPLKVAVRMLKHSSYCPQYEQCSTYLNYLQGRKGSNFTKSRPKEYFVYGSSRQKNVLAAKAL